MRRTVIGETLCVFLALMSLCSAVEVGDEPAAPAKTPATRVLRFPSDRAVGVVHRRPAIQGSYTLTSHTGWTMAGEARGDIAVPGSDDVRLDIAKSASKDLSFLGAIGPESIQVLRLENTDVDDGGLAHIGRLGGLRILDLDHTRITDAGIYHLSGLKRLQQVNLSAFRVEREGFGIGDGGLQILAVLPELEMIGLRRTKVGDKGLEALAGHKSLKWLSVEGTPVTNAGLTHLKTLPALEHLYLGAYREGALITDEGLRDIGELAKLKSLRLSGTKITNDGLVHLRSLSRLEELSLDETLVTQAGLKHLAPLQSLQRMRFYVNSKLDDEGAMHLAALKGLRHLHAHLELTDRGMNALATLPQIEWLTLDGDGGITAAGLRQIARMTSLKDLDLRSCPLEDDVLAEFRTLTNLERLSLSRTRVTGDGLKHLKDLPKLTMLSLSFGDHRKGDHYGDRPHLRQMGELTQLTHLVIHGDGLKSEDLAELRGLVRLNDLSIHGLPVGDEAAVYLGGLTSLTQLELDNASVTDVGMQHIGNLRKLEYLNISGHFTDRGLDHLRKLKSLNSANVSSPYLTDEGLAGLAAALPSLGTADRDTYGISFPEISYRDGDLIRRSGPNEEREKVNSLEAQPPPNWQATEWLNTDGQLLKLADARGKVVLVNFWGTWCGPCIAEMPRLKKLHETYRDRGLLLVGIHTTDGAEQCADYVAKESITWPIASDVDDQMKAVWHVDSYPRFYLIDRSGRLRFAHIYRGDLERAVDTLLAEGETPGEGAPSK